MKKLISLFVVLSVMCVSGCAILGDKVETVETNLDSIEKIVDVLDTTGLVDADQIADVKKSIGEAKKLLESAKAAQIINDKVASEEYIEALLKILVEMEKYKQDK
jgi:hypothetical protein